MVQIGTILSYHGIPYGTHVVPYVYHVLPRCDFNVVQMQAIMAITTCEPVDTMTQR